ncbi:unnamed protein product [marine sediment metagenome]|uniref:Rubredoxin-like domain-containing protein n=1 Tax=marine sediment metagenome TaxID=412755 RepID=X1AVZ4_9ZZZZ
MIKKPTPLETKVNEGFEPTQASRGSLTIHTCICQKCGYEWIPRKKRPVACPQCSCRNWEKTEEQRKIEGNLVKCKRCGYEWLPRGYEWLPHREKPEICPRCKSRYWSVDRVIYPEVTCLRCGNKWIPRKERPGACPACHRDDWDKIYPKYTGEDYNLIVAKHPKPSPKSPPEETHSDNIELDRIHWEEGNQRK